MTSAFTEIPVVDFGPFINGTLEEKTQVAEEIGNACRHIGFFYLKNHGIAPDLIKDAFDQVQRYFTLSLEEKMASFDDPVRTEGRGYAKVFQEIADESTADKREGFYIGLELPADDKYRVEHGLICYGPNTWPKTLPGKNLMIQQTLTE
jgi:isopenicillin N synthase-like dioxygenase